MLYYHSHGKIFVILYYHFVRLILKNCFMIYNVFLNWNSQWWNDTWILKNEGKKQNWISIRAIVRWSTKWKKFSKIFGRHVSIEPKSNNSGIKNRLFSKWYIFYNDAKTNLDVYQHSVHFWVLGPTCHANRKWPKINIAEYELVCMMVPNLDRQQRHAGPR